MNDDNTIRELWFAGYKKWALWKACPFAPTNPRFILGEFKLPKHYLRGLKLL